MGAYKPGYPAGQGTFSGHPERERFRIDMAAAVGGEWQFLCLPAVDDTTTWTDLSRNSTTITLGHSFQLFETNPAGKGFGMDIQVDGTRNETATIADANAYSFGDASTDHPFSVVMLINPSAADIAGGATLFSKWAAGLTAYREWKVGITSSGYPQMSIHDESVSSASQVVEYRTPLTAGTWTFLAFSYDGRGGNSASPNGFNIYKDGVGVSLTANNGGGTYVAMENSTAEVHIGPDLNSNGAPANIYAGRWGFIGLIPKDLHADEASTMRGLVNNYFTETF